MTATHALSKDELLTHIQTAWNKLTAYLDTLSQEQLTQPKDAAGWTVKDHVIHLAVWEGGVLALLNHQSRIGYMGLDEADWKSRDLDRINAVIQQQHRQRSLDDVLATFQAVHRQMVERIQSMTEEDLYQPYRHYQPSATASDPVIDTIIGDTFEHYAEHQSWIAAIVGADTLG